MRKLLLAFLIAVLGHGPTMPWPTSAAACEFVLGFKTLSDAIPAIVGECVEDQRYDPVSGDALQRTAGGLLFWRRADNHTAFTDGYRTWLNGPYGVQQRLNTQRLGWEVVEQARNTEYRLPLVDPTDRGEKETVIRMVNGEYTSSSESPPLRVRAGVLSDLIAIGDLDGDGVPDAAAPLWLNTGGSGTFIYLIPLLDRNPVLVQAGRAFLGDRVKLNTIAITNDGTTTIDMIAHGPGDPMCCPTRLVVRTFQAADLLTIVGPAEIDARRISLDTQGLSAAWRADVVSARPYDRSQPPGPRGLPKHLRITLGDSEAYRVGEPVMFIIPLAAYQQLWEKQGDRGVTNMLGKIGPLVSLLPSPPPISGLPALPYEQIGGVNDLSVQLGRASVAEKSASRNGFRYVGRFAQDANPVSRENLRYIYLGFTNDGQYLVVFFHPVTTTALPAIQDIPAEEFDRVVRDHRAYMQEKADMLNKLPTSAWQPDLAKLDALVGSLEIKGMPSSGIIGPVWHWERTVYAGMEKLVDAPEKYTLTFRSDGTLSFRADCNLGRGPYTVTDPRSGMAGGLRTGPLATTRAACEPGSRSTELIDLLTTARDYDLRQAGQVLALKRPEAGVIDLFRKVGGGTQP